MHGEKEMTGFDEKTNSQGEYELTFYTNDYDEYKEVETLCRKLVESRMKGKKNEIHK